MPASARQYVLYADGACLGNPGPGGWGVVIAEPASEYRELSGGPYPATTNNKMEITAAIEGLRDLEPGCEVIVRSDSSYVVNTMMLGWKRKANDEFWRDLDREAASRKVRFEWVRGHAGDKNNERADSSRLPLRGASSWNSNPPCIERSESDLEKLEPLLDAGRIDPALRAMRPVVCDRLGRARLLRAGLLPIKGTHAGNEPRVVTTD